MDLLCKVTILWGLLLSAGDGLSLYTAVRRSKPGLRSPPKLWWAKEITPDFHVAGRPTARQIKYAYEGGFKSILSLYEYQDNDSGDFGGEYLPTTTEAAELATSLGLGYKSLIDRKAEWWTVETVKMFGEAIRDLPRPILLHCNRGYTISYVTLMYMANLTRHDPGFEPKIYSNNFYRITAAMGLNFTADHIKETVSAITGEDIATDPPKPDAVPTNWRDWWLAHPVAKTFFAAGQLRRADVKVLEKTGFKAVVNVRLGATNSQSQVTQEQVTLLNVVDNTPTFGSQTSPRQSKPMLERSRINPNLGPEYISPDSEVNYERQNTDEFGDFIGYSEVLERTFFKQHAMKYYHFPIDKDVPFDLEKWDDILDTLTEAGKKGPVLVHCRDGERAAHIGVLAAAMQEGYSLEWALNRLAEIGFEVSPKTNPSMFNLYTEFLISDGTNQEKDEHFIADARDREKIEL